MDWIPPKESEKTKLILTTEEIEKNKEKLELENLKREQNERENFISEKHFLSFAKENNLNDNIWVWVQKSRANWIEILQLFYKTPEKYQQFILPLLNVLTEKDLYDFKSADLIAHITFSEIHFLKFSDNKNIFYEYLLNPRVSNEKLSNYKEELLKNEGKDYKNLNFNELLKILEDKIINIELAQNTNFFNVPITPIGVFKINKADIKSLKIFAVSLYRTYGIASRLEPGTENVQIYKENNWEDLLIRKEFKKVDKKKFPLKLFCNSEKIINKLEYFHHYTIARIINGKLITLVYNYDEYIENTLLEEGDYVIISGNRDSIGRVFVKTKFFNVPNDNKVEIEMRDFCENKIENIGKINLNLTLRQENNENDIVLEKFVEKFEVVLFYNFNFYFKFLFLFYFYLIFYILFFIFNLSKIF